MNLLKNCKSFLFNAFYFKNSPNSNFLVCYVYVLVWKYVLLFQNVTTASVSYNSRHLKFGHLLRSEYFHSFFYFLVYLKFFVPNFYFKVEEKWFMLQILPIQKHFQFKLVFQFRFYNTSLYMQILCMSLWNFFRSVRNVIYLHECKFLFLYTV